MQGYNRSLHNKPKGNTTDRQQLPLPSNRGGVIQSRHEGSLHTHLGINKTQIRDQSQSQQRHAIQGGDNTQLIELSTGLSQDEILNICTKFKRYDPMSLGFIQWFEVDDVFRDIGLQVTEEVRSQTKKYLDERKKRNADLHLTCELYAVIKKQQEDEEEEAQNADFVNAFVAMGGNPDRSGCVQKSVILDIIKNVF